MQESPELMQIQLGRLREQMQTPYVVLAIILCIVGSAFCVLVVVGYWYRCNSACF